MNRAGLLVLGAMLCNVLGWTQNGNIAAKLGYPQTIVYNGKIVTMDDNSFTSAVGAIVQAMAVRDGKILATGSTAEIRALAGPQTKQIDLKGRTVLPSFALTHEHPTDWVFIEPRAFRHVLPNDDVIISRWMPNLPPKEQLARLEGVVKEAVAKAKPGQWIRVIFNWGPDYEWAAEMQDLFSKSITKAYLDQLAPNNPMTVKDGFIGSIANKAAVEVFRTVHPDLDFYTTGRRGAQPSEERIRRVEQSGNLSRPVDPDAMLKGKLPILADLLKAEMELWVRHGITAFGSGPYSAFNLQAFNLLDQQGRMPARFVWAYQGPAWDLETLRVMAGALGQGSDYLWLGGAFSGSGSGCMTIPEKPGWREEQGRGGEEGEGGRGGGGGENCTFAPGTVSREINERIIESGMRLAGVHTGGDKDIDYFMDSIEAGAKKAGMTLEQIRAKRNAFDHSSGAPRPEQIPRVKNLGMMVSQINTILWETHRGASVTAKQYGIEYTNWVVPRKSVTEAGIMNTMEIDRPLPHKIFFFITKGMNRYNDRDKQVYGPGERTDRITQLKALTRWSGYYFMREDRMGTLEPGKYADFIVLDRDFLTVPEADIPKIEVLMTMVGGKMIHLGADLAREIGMTPAGASTWTEPVPDGWIEKRW
ncbi:MAG: amidohydrolase family protein [Acidobacteria bacterium]|nr:amidohydrolase family protein [Acidobacteriota bacterium]